MATIAEEEKKKRGSYGDAAAAALDSDVTQLKYGKPGDFPVNPDGTPMQKMGFGPSAAVPAPDAQGGAAFGVPPSMGRRPQQPVQAPSTQAEIPATQRIGWRTDAVMNGAASDAQSAFDKGNYAETAGTLVRGAAAAVPAAFVDFGEGLAGGIVPAVKGFYRGMTGGDAITDPPASALKPVVGATAAQAAPKPVTPSPAAAPAQVVAPAAATESAPDGSPKVNDPGQVTSADRMAMDSKAHADELASIKLRQQIQDGGAPAEGFTPATIRHSGNDWQARNDLRNLQVSASSMTADANSPEMLAYRAALETDKSLKQGNNPALVAANHDGAFMDRTQAAERAANARFGMSNKIAQQKADAEQAKLGFDTKAASQIQALQQQIVSETDPKKLAVLQEKLQTITGKYQRPEPANRFTVVPSGQAVDPKTGQTYTVPPRVLDNQTGRFVDQPSGSGSEQSPYKDGQELVGKDGKTYIVTNGQPVLKK